MLQKNILQLNVSVSIENITVTDLSGQIVSVPHPTANKLQKMGLFTRIGNILNTNKAKKNFITLLIMKNKYILFLVNYNYLWF